MLDMDVALGMPKASRDRIDGNRPRRTRRWMTAMEADRNAPHWSQFVTRQRVNCEVPCALCEARERSRRDAETDEDELG